MSDTLGARPWESSASDQAAFDMIDLSEAQVQARATWYYYIGGLTQQEIADKLGITRLRVNRIVGQARTDGLIHIDIQIPLASCVALEERLKDRYGLRDVSVVPSIDDDAMRIQTIGEAAAVMLQPKLKDGVTLGIGNGRTLGSMVRRLKPNRFANSHVISLMGGQTFGSNTNIFEICRELARVLGARCSYIAAPIFAPSEEGRAILMSHAGLAEVLRAARQCDIAVVDCNTLTDQANEQRDPILADQLKSLRSAGTVGDLIGTFLDGNGGIVDHPLNARVMALGPQELKAIPVSILVAGGLDKLPIIRAALRNAYVNGLATDEKVAEALLA